MDKKVIALLMIVAVLSGSVGYYAATLGHRAYYVKLDVNVGECITQSGSTSCQAQHNVVYNTGATWLEAQFTNANPTGGGVMKYIALSNDGQTPAVSDAVSGLACGAFNSGSGQIITNGLSASAGTITLGSGASPQTVTIAHTFTDSTAGTTVQKSCLMNESTIDANDQQFASALFSTAALSVGDTIQVTWTLTWTY